MKLWLYAAVAAVLAAIAYGSLGFVLTEQKTTVEINTEKIAVLESRPEVKCRACAPCAACRPCKSFWSWGK